jgi:16S rRNA G1207 methylase RsmC
VRPTDLADEPHRLPTAIPLLAASLPADPPGRILVFRSGYGLLPALLLERYPAAHVVAVDRDLLAVAFTRRNCAGHPGRFRADAMLGVPEDLGPFDLILGELSPPLGPAAAIEELRAARRALAPGGHLLALCLLGQWKGPIRKCARELRIVLRKSRGPVAILESTMGA